MNKFVKVATWYNGDYYNTPQILYVNIDCIEKFYREPNDNINFNFRAYFSDEQDVQEFCHNPTVIVTKDGKMYYSPVDLNDSKKFDVEEIESRFDIIDL